MDAANDARALDPLGEAIAWLTRHHGRERSVAALRALDQSVEPLDGPRAVQALREAGFHAELLERPLAELPEAILPVVLLLRGGEACLMTARQVGEGGQAVCEIVLPGPRPQALRTAQAELAQEHTGIVLAARPDPLAAAASASQALPSWVREDPASHWLWGTLRLFIPHYRSAMVASLLSNVLMMVTGLITSVVYDKVIPQQAEVTLWALASAGLLALVFDFTARQLRSHLIDVAGRKADLLVGTTLFRQSLGVRMESRPDSSGAYTHLLAQVEQVREFFSSASLSALADLPFIAIFIAMTFVIGGPLGFVPLLAVPLLMGAALASQGRLRRASNASLQQRADLNGVLVETVEGMEDIKATGAHGRFLRQYEASSALAAESQLRSRAVMSWTINFNAVSQQAITLVMLVWGVYLIQSKSITAGALMGGVMFAMRAIAPLSSVVMLATRYQGARSAMRALDRVMSQPLERDVGRSYLTLRDAAGRVALHDVAFAYPQPATVPGAVGGGLGPKVLDGVNLNIGPGERVAVLGRIGSGKSTILRMLGGLYLPTEGHVSVDGVDLRQIDPVDHRARVAYVPQDPRLFSGSVRDNVLLGRAGADAARLADIARITGLQRVVDGHPQGWDMPVGDAGALLSGGQRQLVALARSLITQPRVVLMDEPTSSMDAQSELAFLRQLREATVGCTLIMVTHRPAVLELVDRVVVVDGGRVVMDGPKAKVLAILSGQQAVPQQGQRPPAQAPTAEPAEAALA